MMDSRIIEFNDPYTGDRSLIIVRTYKDKIALGISIEKDSDLETVIDLRIAKELVDLLQNAIKNIEKIE